MLLFAHRLAVKLGIMDVEGMLAAVSARQLLRWRAYELLEPWGFPIEDRRHVQRCLAACGGRCRPETFSYRPPVRLGRAKRFLTAAEIRQRIREAGK